MPDLIRRGARFLARRTFSFWEKLGLHLTYVHYYEPIPDTRSLNDAVWNRSTELPGIKMNSSFQAQLLRQLSAAYRETWEALPRNGASKPAQFFLGNEWFDSGDAEILHGIIRRFKPRHLYEIGAGFSSLLAAQAISENREEDYSYSCEHVAIEPFPPPFLSEGNNGISLLPKKVQQIPLDAFARLERNDVLFIDSSHVVTIGSDVQYEYLEILPRLKPGVLVHCHDIFLPAEYPKDWVLGCHRFWNEQYLLQAFLTHNSEFEVLWAGSYMHLKHPDLLAAAIPSYKQEECHPKSFWIRRKG
jgi:hypothetical protein